MSTSSACTSIRAGHADGSCPDGPIGHRSQQEAPCRGRGAPPAGAGVTCAGPLRDRLCRCNGWKEFGLTATFIYAGIDLESAGLFAGTKGRQIAGQVPPSCRPRRSPTTSGQSLQRHEPSGLSFQLYRRGGRVILHHGHIRPVLIRDWSRSMDGIAATIWTSQTTLSLEPRDRLKLAASSSVDRRVNLARPAAEIAT